MKRLLYGITLIILLGIGGFLYRNAIEHPAVAVACPVSSYVCPDGTRVTERVPGSCTFVACSPPNVVLEDIDLAFAIPDGFVATESPDPSMAAAYIAADASSTETGDLITIQRFAVGASSTPLAVIRETAISGTSGEPVPITAFSSISIGRTSFTVVTIERFEGVVDTAYYFARGGDILRFDAIDQGVANWTSPTLDVSTLPANRALRKLLSTLE